MASLLKRFTPLLASAVLGLSASACLADDSAMTVETEKADLKVTRITDGLKNPWGLTFLPNGDMLVTERAGQMRVVTPAGEKGPALKGLPEIASRGQGGLLDVALDPDFSENRWVYFSFSEPGKDGKTSTAVARGKLLADAMDQLSEVEVIFSQKPKVNSNGHFGSRLVFRDDGTLFITMGDRQQDFEDNYPQELDSHIGTVARINPDGSVPEDNPFVDTKGALPEIWSYGHRNVQGADLHPQTRELWTGEHGPQGGDEINITLAGNNYGWPIITYGEQYGGGEIGTGTHKEGMEQPVHYWVPSIANCGMTFYTGDQFPQWKGNLLVTSLKFQLVSRLELDGEKVTHEERFFDESIGKRLRDIVQGPDGNLYLLTDDSNGAIIKVEPAK
ncbi:PQQ-dependent sugar dehydrogenase [Marinimicrobium agarilyticum]|uniref:PQQ-dependent sugar dehydrogenase n=1 Tax=Marinimicrobium agarilyticum TaxID=306546 RepID=UPI00040207C0|nr:PQQ-dependent sugar dehydrogenase [Marinimicrobium agarilyticum]